MRKPILFTLILAALCLFATAGSARAAVLYGESAVGYDSSGRYVYGYGMTWTDYDLAWYYDPEVYTVLLQYETALDSGSNVGYSDPYWGYQVAAEYDTFSWAYQPSTVYSTASHHKVRPYYNNGYGYWFDPFNFFGFAEGTYGGYWGLGGYPYNPYNYIPAPVVHPFNTYVEIVTPPDTFQTPTPTPTPAATPTPPQCSAHTVQIIAGNRDITEGSGTALIGAIATFQAVVDGSGAEAGSYSWSFQDGQATDANTAAIKNIYWTSQGAKTVRLEFTPEGESCKSTVTATVNVVLPTVESYSAWQTNASVHPGGNCGDIRGGLGQTAFQLGCGFSQPGIKFDATVRAPADLITIPGDSKIKFVQFFNAYATAHTSSGQICAMTRSNEFDTTTGWLRDGSDPYGLVQPVPFNNDTGVATSSAVDSPGYAIDFPGQVFDYFRNNDHFEMYLVYIAGDNFNPRYQQVLSMIPWYYTGEIFFSSPGVWSQYEATPAAQQRFGTAPNNRVYNIGDATSVDWSSCSGGPNPEPTPFPEPTPEPDPCLRMGWKCDYYTY
jgi:hypothetical protein